MQMQHSSKVSWAAETVLRQRTAWAAASPEKRQERLDADAAQHRVSRAADCAVASPEKRQERLDANASTG
jgi:hypothetical protein